jgi:ribosomal protein S18 acetylase RimI-like enzyme
MQQTTLVNLEIVSSAEISDFLQLVEAYWQALMPHAPVVKDGEHRQAYFRERFTWAGGNRHPYWAVVDGRKVGFVSFTVSVVSRSARVEDFYISPTERRKGYGSALVRALYTHFDRLDIELIELNVRRDNPKALLFWEAQGFRIALHCLRQYRDPKTGIGFIGGLSSDFVTEVDT